MGERTLAPSETDARNRAVLAIADAVCGYMKLDGVHECRREKLGQGLGCEPTTWAQMMRRIEGVLEGWEPVHSEQGPN